MYFILDNNTGKTVATTSFEDAAYFIAEHFPAECVVRYVPTSNAAYKKGAKFFENSKEMKKGA